jgi:hypothetical protein
MPPQNEGASRRMFWSILHHVSLLDFVFHNLLGSLPIGSVPTAKSVVRSRISCYFVDSTHACAHAAMKSQLLPPLLHTQVDFSP